MTRKTLNLAFNGLVTALGELQSPTGGMATAENILFPAPGLAEKRKGSSRLSSGFGAPIWEVIDSPNYTDGKVFVQVGVANRATGMRLGDGVAASTLLTLPDGQSFESTNANNYRARMAILGGTQFFTTYYGATRLAAGLTTPKYAGAPKAPGFDSARASGILTGTGGYLADGYSVAYRVVVGFTETAADGSIIEVLGSPSGRTVVSNVTGTAGYAAGVAKNVILRLTIPKQVRCKTAACTTSFFFQVYRSGAVDYSASVPSDEMQLCYQENFNSTDISNGWAEITDTCPEAALGAYLYTNSISGGDVQTAAVRFGNTGPGIAAQNDPPPYAYEVAQYAGCAFWANLTYPSQIVTSLVGLPAVGAVITAGDGTRTYTAVAGAPASASEFQVASSGTLAANLQQTALNLTEAINNDSGQTQIYAYFAGNDSSPGSAGKMILEARRRLDPVFLTASSHAARDCFLPHLPSTGTTAIEQIQTNGLAISKPFQGDAVCPANYVTVGPSTATILAMIPLREALYIFTDAGLYWLRGSSPADFTIDLLSPTFRLWGQRGAVSLGDEIYAWGREGIARISDGGVRNIDVPIRNYVQEVERGLGFDTFRNTANIADYFAIGYRTQRRVMFYFPVSSSTRNCEQALVWNVATETWSTFRYQSGSGRSAGCVRTVDEVAITGAWNGTPTDSWIFADNNAGTLADYRDVDVGGAAKSITTLLEWNQISPDPTTLNRFQEMTVFLSPSQVNSTYTALPASIRSTFTTDTSPTPSIVDATPIENSLRMLVPRTSCMGIRMGLTVTHAQIDEYFAICGVSFLYTPLSTGAVK